MRIGLFTGRNTHAQTLLMSGLLIPGAWYMFRLITFCIWNRLQMLTNIN